MIVPPWPAFEPNTYVVELVHLFLRTKTEFIPHITLSSPHIAFNYGQECASQGRAGSSSYRSPGVGPP